MPIKVNNIIIKSLQAKVNSQEKTSSVKPSVSWSEQRRQISMSLKPVRENFDRQKIKESNEINTIKTSKYLEDLTTKGD